MEGLKELRRLAYEYYEAALSPENAERRRLHRAVNDLKMERPVVLISEIPFHELNFDGSLTLKCTDPDLRRVEDRLRKTLFQWKYFPADMILHPFVSIEKVVYNTGDGIKIEDDRIYDKTDKDQQGISSHKYHDQLATLEDLDKITLPTLTYDKEETMRRYTKVAEAIGDIVPVKVTAPWGNAYCHPWDDIAMYRGAEPLLIDLYDEPEFTHEMVSRLFACAKHRIDQMEALELFEMNPTSLHCTTALCSDLDKDYDGGKVTRKNMWFRGMAQIFSCVSKAMHDEFDIQYMKEIAETFGATYYGCCEPLDKKIDILEQISNLRKISISPWADVEIAAEAINTKYVVGHKPNPAAVTVPLDEDAHRKDMARTLSALKRNGCNADIVLKDISSAGHNVQNLIRWEQITMEMVKNF